MPPLEGQGRRTKLSKAFSDPRIVLAIDYGTTFTGILLSTLSNAFF
jgi:hypothetical protein